jgi:hypothetical protein
VECCSEGRLRKVKEAKEVKKVKEGDERGRKEDTVTNS